MKLFVVNSLLLVTGILVHIFLGELEEDDHREDYVTILATEEHNAKDIVRNDPFKGTTWKRDVYAGLLFHYSNKFKNILLNMATEYRKVTS